MMRLICPNCGAQYAVDDGVIPPEGRDVQCSACGGSWFQARDERPPEPEPEARPESGSRRGLPVADLVSGLRPAGDAGPPPRRPVDEAVLQVLREEAVREQGARRAEREALEQGLDAASAPSGAGSDRPDVAEPAKAASEADGLPDAGKINSTLQPPQTLAARLSDASGRRDARARGRRYGLALAFAAFAGLTALYAQADRLSQTLPQAAPALAGYAASVDAGRLWLDSRFREALSMVYKPSG
ncbi:MAG: zinc-ribbon domain-containing protein [Tropicimonas sp.]|uniref:zinc-ribbon domain-containing protein n=1 Tax=Tropicimonas sp. TaxID=2067044 RepID=UPI003A85DFC6